MSRPWAGKKASIINGFWTLYASSYTVIQNGINVAIFDRLLLIDAVCNRLWKILHRSTLSQETSRHIVSQWRSPPPTYQSSFCIESSVQFSRIIKSYLHKVANIVSWPSYLPQGHLWLHYSDNQKIFDMIRTKTISGVIQVLCRRSWGQNMKKIRIPLAYR